MAFTQTVVPELAELQNYLGGVAKNIADKVYGPQGPAWGTRFGDLEELAVQVGQAVSAELLGQALRRQAAEAVPKEDDACPTCRGPLDRGDPQPRAVATRVGAAQWDEPTRTCRRCRRDFFPSVEAAGD
jgi:hypothetical protein